jgi:predicted HD phosphohydrolase
VGLEPFNQEALHGMLENLIIRKHYMELVLQRSCNYGFVGLEPSNHTRAQQSYPQLHHTQPYTGQAYLHSLGSQTYLHPARNSTKAKTYPCSHSPYWFCSTSMLPSRFQQTHGEPTMFHHPVNHSQHNSNFYMQIYAHS